MQHTVLFVCLFFVHFFAVVLHDCNVKLPETFLIEEMSYVFSFTFFFTAAHFLLALVAASISQFVTAATKFSFCSSNKKMCLLCFLSLALDLYRPFSLSLALYSKFIDMTINLSLII